ncbi:hypothetical protein A3H89_01350 [Candidatus Amesbacteria bacterium RIFCSPLOWO2_02_FULL_48_11]|nr:MAG: hypothetical protein A2V48_00235 [Candidatus Amesbacteria bacterium RBG_19FT_COMBO_48_16]OGC97243.1 MAG: hypothetical protein A3C34_04355 [Candidatus Amesbacteria bacterium RIFCSPHIGHO2_02_FULL_48_21]OGC99284.1 MAG: hypothetical protein A2W16_02705 [Candidatus Amesbacteria bacterium RBG_16_48_31]OGD05362.1 MAG: hypothetical protein A3H89_01350 [Candidatus Amesbacteria bacterium RIFCSPLOWO2_02_FULL_48_11]
MNIFQKLGSVVRGERVVGVVEGVPCDLTVSKHCFRNLEVYECGGCGTAKQSLSRAVKEKMEEGSLPREVLHLLSVERHKVLRAMTSADIEIASVMRGVLAFTADQKS